MEKNVAISNFLKQMGSNEVEVADLSMSYVKDPSCIQIGKSLSNNQSLIRLQLQMCYISDKGCSFSDI